MFNCRALQEDYPDTSLSKNSIFFTVLFIITLLDNRLMLSTILKTFLIFSYRDNLEDRKPILMLIIARVNTGKTCFKAVEQHIILLGQREF